MKLETNAVSYSAGGLSILQSVTLSCATGEFIGIVGPNGSGKTTLLRCIYRALFPDHGTVIIGGNDIWRMSAGEAARRTAAVLQERGAETEFTVREVVLMGRAPHKRPLDGDSSDDLRRVSLSLESVGVAHLADRIFETLSGGEKQRVLVARALTQDSRVLVLDEPTTHLEHRHQLDVLNLVRRLKLTTIAVLHDLNLAAMYCDRIVVLTGGKLAAAGTPSEILTTALIRDVFGVSAEVVSDSESGTPRVFFRATR